MTIQIFLKPTASFSMGHHHGQQLWRALFIDMDHRLTLGNIDVGRSRAYLLQQRSGNADYGLLFRDAGLHGIQASSPDAVQAVIISIFCNAMFPAPVCDLHTGGTGIAIGEKALTK